MTTDEADAERDDGVDECFGAHCRGEAEEGAGHDRAAPSTAPTHRVVAEHEPPEHQCDRGHVLPEVERIDRDGRTESDDPERGPALTSGHSSHERGLRTPP